MVFWSHLFQILFLVVANYFVIFSSFSIQDECVFGRYNPSSTNKVKWYTVNLDLPPLQRWQHVVQDYKPQIANLIKYVRLYVQVITHSTFVWDMVQSEFPKILATLPQPYQDEIKGIANATEISQAGILVFNIFYEISMLCTSIVAQDSNGILYHARNLDFGAFMGYDVKNQTYMLAELLRELVINVKFEKDGKTLHTGTYFAGYVGSLTAVKTNVLTLSVNERPRFNGAIIGMLEWIMGKRDAWWLGFLNREVMETAQSYDQAVEMLSNTKLIAPVYFIIGGNSSGQGCVITRSPDAIEDIWKMNSIYEHNWFIVETNSDRKEEPLFLDPRSASATKCMLLKGIKRVGYPALFDVLSSRPVFDKETIYTTLMQVGNASHLESYIQYCSDPCIPW